MLYNSDFKGKPGGFLDKGADLDDLLDGFDFNEKGSSKTGTAAASSTLETSLDSLKLSVEAKSLGASSLNESSNTSSTTTSAMRGVQKRSGVAASSSARRSLLDSLLSPEDVNGAATGMEVNLDSSFEVKAAPTAATSRRSVRFSEKPQGDNAPDLPNVNERVKRDGEADNNDKDTNSRPRTAPAARDRSGVGWGDLEESLDWFSKDHSGGSGTGGGEFKGGLQKTTCNISIDGGLDLDTTLTEKKIVSRESSNLAEERSILVGGGKGTAVRRSLNFKGSKERSPSWEPQRSPSLLINDAVVDGSEAAPKIRQLQAEIEALRGLLKMTKDYHREEIKLLEQSQSSKIKLLEENSLRREKHLQEELDFTVSQCKLRIGQLESFQETARAELASTMAAARDDALKTVATLRNEHTLELEALTERHAKALASLREADATEARVLTEMQPTAEALQVLLGQLLSATNEVKQAEVEHQTAIAQRLVKLERREEIIRLAEERLCDRERESDRTHKLLTEAVGKLEVQLREQSKLLEDDRWTLKQEQARLTKIQATLEEDRRALIEQAGRERIELQQLITNFFDEHRETQSRLAAERNSITEEQQKLRVDQVCWRRQQEEEEKKLTSLKGEMERTKESLQVERHALDERIHQLKLNEVKLTETQHHLDIVRSNLQGKETCLNEREAELDRRQEELTNRAGALSGTQAAVAEVDAKCRRLMEEQTRTQTELQSRRQELEDMEKRLAKEEEDLARREAEYARKAKAEKKLICSRCKQVVKKVSRGGHDSSPKRHQPDRDVEARWVETPSPDNLCRDAFISKPEAVRLIEDISNHQTRSRLLEELRQELAKDNEFLEDERIFLTTLKYAPYMQ
uniref:Fas binding factor 1 n=1 Tax=Echinococcus granulosus TaxID=6210 RepID=A0A068WIG3_ECHGR|nr:fas binding factor 1 [Echinococcus granulosus]